MDIKLPEVGENITSGTVISILVKVGDLISQGQDLIELETDKASLPVPAPSAGTVKEILVSTGQDVKIGSVIMRFDPAGKTAAAAPASSAPAPAAAKSEAPKKSATASPTPAPAPRAAAVHTAPAGPQIDP